MKKAAKIVVVIIALSIGNTGYAQTVAPPYEVGTWQGFRPAAISFTFDDGSPNQYAKAIPMFNEFDLKMTLYIVTSPSWGWPANWSALQTAASRGHEIGSHTVSHTSMGGMNDALQTTELKNSQDEINAHITGQRCATLAYPYCVPSKKSLCAQYYIAARICSGVIESRTPADFMNLGSIICGELGSVKTTQDFISRAGSAVNSKGWCVFLIHGIDNDGGYSSLPSTTLRETLEYFNANEDKFWVSTFSNVARYIKERAAVSVVESSAEEDRFIVQVTDTLDNAIFNYPTTLRRPLPQEWPSVAVAQNGRTVESQILESNSLRYIQFDATPDSGEVIISRSNATSVQDSENFVVTPLSLLQNHPNPFNPSTTIRFDLGLAEHVTLKVFDVSGREVATLLDEELPGGRHSVLFNAEMLASGVYLLNLQAQGLSQYRKMLLLR